MKEWDKEFMYIVYLPTLGLSIIGCSIVIVLYVFARSLRSYAFTLVFWLNLSDLIRTLVLFILVIEPKALKFCEVFGTIFNFGMFSAYFWTLTIALTIYQDLVLCKKDLQSNFKFWLIANNLSAVTFAVLPVLFYGFGEKDKICLVVKSRFGLMYSFVTLTLVYGLVLSLIAIIYISIYCKYSMRTAQNKEENISFKKLLAFPSILVVCTLPAVVDYLLSLWGIENIYLNVFSIVFWSLHGFFDFLAYAFTRHVRGYLKSVFLKRPSYWAQLEEFN